MLSMDVMVNVHCGQDIPRLDQTEVFGLCAACAVCRDIIECGVVFPRF